MVLSYKKVQKDKTQNRSVYALMVFGGLEGARR